MKIKALYLGDWFQRTQLHLSEIHDFLVDKSSPLKLDSKLLEQNKKSLGVLDVHSHIGRLNSLEIKTKLNIDFSIYEDGLVLFRKLNIKNLEEDKKELADFYRGPYSKSMAHLFSLGAPIPKDLTKVQPIMPYFIVTEGASKEEISEIFKITKNDEYFDKTLSGFDLYRGDNIYVINQKSISDKALERFISELVFFREFRGQLHQYLNFHRVIWENISDVKERGFIRGNDIKPFKSKIESYEKTINLIDTRINQMGVYIKTRGSILKDTPELLDATDKVFNFQHETLEDSLSYVKEIWSMTKNYVSATLKVFSDLQAKVLDNSVKNLTLITTLGVGGTIYKLLTGDPSKISFGGLTIFVGVAAISLVLIFVLKYIHVYKKYKIKDITPGNNIK